MKVFEYLLHYNLGYTVQIKRKGLDKKYIHGRKAIVIGATSGIGIHRQGIENRRDQGLGRSSCLFLRQALSESLSRMPHPTGTDALSEHHHHTY